MDHSNIAKKFSDARRNLMLPHPLGVPQSISAAFSDASLALFCVKRDELDETPREWIAELETYLDTSEFQHLPSGQFLAKAERLNDDDLLRIRHLIDELAHWFYAASYGRL